MHKNEALPCPARLDPASHPVETVGTRRVALGYASMGLRVEARKDMKALSTSCESTFIGLRKYIQQLMKALSKKVTLYSVKSRLIPSPIRAIFFSS